MRKTSSASDARIWMASESSLLGFTLPIDLKEFADGSLLCRSIRIPVDKMEHKRLFGDPVELTIAFTVVKAWLSPKVISARRYRNYKAPGLSLRRLTRFMGGPSSALTTRRSSIPTRSTTTRVSKIYGTIKGTNFDSNKCGWIYPASSTVKSLVFAIGNTMYTVSYVRFRPMIFTYIGVMFAAECGGLPIRILGDIFLKSVCSVLN
ncbi:hypothetical protein B0H19DRAFT_1277604 [Mycena capillaripes]|nr:hypothetical protein B0H19DRAFT_1277604 [Mycena capillaripes]